MVIQKHTCVFVSNNQVPVVQKVIKLIDFSSGQNGMRKIRRH